VEGKRGLARRGCVCWDAKSDWEYASDWDVNSDWEYESGWGVKSD
jgi:hypothetical protein